MVERNDPFWIKLVTILYAAVCAYLILGMTYQSITGCNTKSFLCPHGPEIQDG